MDAENRSEMIDKIVAEILLQDNKTNNGNTTKNDDPGSNENVPDNSNPQSCSSTTPTETLDENVLNRISKMDRNKMHNMILIEVISQNPALWDSTNPQFGNYQYRQIIWDNISIVLKCSTKKVKQRWASLKRNYRKSYVRQLKTGLPTKMYYYDKMSFLEEEMKTAIETEEAILKSAINESMSLKSTNTQPIEPNDTVDDCEVEEISDDDDDDCCIIDVVMKTPTDPPQSTSTPTTPQSAPPAPIDRPTEIEGIVPTEGVPHNVRLRNISDLIDRPSMLIDRPSIPTPRVDSTTPSSTDTPKIFPKDPPAKKKVRFSDEPPAKICKKEEPDVVFIEEKFKEIPFKLESTPTLPSVTDERQGQPSSTFQHAVKVSFQTSTPKNVGDFDLTITPTHRRKSDDHEEPKDPVKITKNEKPQAPDLGTTITCVPPYQRNADESELVNSSKTATARKSTSRTSAGTARHEDDWVPDLQVVEVKTLQDNKAAVKDSILNEDKEDLKHKMDIKDQTLKKQVKEKLRDDANLGFLMSLLGDVETMTNSQFRVLKKHSTALVSAILDKGK